MPEYAVVDVIVAGARGVGDARVAVLESRVPDPDVERVEVPERDAGARISNEPRSPDAGLGETAAFESAVDAVFDVDKPIVAVFVSGIEVGARPVPRLFHRHRRAPPPVERQPR